MTTWISGLEPTDAHHPFTAVRHYAITHVSDGVLLARTRMLWETADVKTEQPIRIPDTFLADLAPNIAE